MTVASNVAPRMEYVGNAAPTTLSGDLSASGTSFNLTDPTGYPQGVVGKFTLVVNKGGQTEEKILCDTRTSSQINVNSAGRGYDGTLAQTHDAGESVQVCWAATAADADNLHNNSTAGVHGVAGNVVGDTDTQTLKNKTIDGSLNTLRNVPATAVTGLVTALLARTSNNTAYSPTSTSMAALDATNLSLPFTVPASGKVLARVTAEIFCPSTITTLVAAQWVPHGSSTIVTGSHTHNLVSIAGQAGSQPTFSTTGAQLVTGLTPGANLTWDLAVSVAAAGNTVKNVCLEIWTA